MYNNQFEYLNEEDLLYFDENRLCYEQYYNEDCTMLTFPSRFNDPIANIDFADGLECINFGSKFNKPLENAKFPPSLKSIKFGKKFNRSIDNIIFPENLETLEFGEKFNKTINNLPPFLKKIIFNRITKVHTNLPCTLDSIVIKEYFTYDQIMACLKIPYGCNIYNIDNIQINF